jgi:hypothetical protein
MNLMLLLFAAAAAPDWMTGCWSGQSGPMTFEEQWSKPAGGSMMGLARTMKGGKVVFSEFMRIDSRNNTLVYTPRIGSKQAPVEFTLKSQSDTQVIFENATHDFPQRILYTRNVDGLHARIEGTDKGKHRAEDFPMKAVACK